MAQPETNDELLDVLESAAPLDLAVVVAYGRIIRPEALAIPAEGMLNVHFSLLPRWRGAAPVNRALMEGDPMTGVTIIRIDEGLDTGDVLTAQAVDISADENAGALTARLASLGARLLVSSMGPYLRGELHPVPQTDEGATYAAKLTKEDRVLSPAMTTSRFLATVRGLAPAPGATLRIDDTPVKILEANHASGWSVPSGQWSVVDSHPMVGLSDGAVRLVQVQPAGRNVMSADAWANGARSTGGFVA